jgi:hypothetical protein
VESPARSQYTGFSADDRRVVGIARTAGRKARGEMRILSRISRGVWSREVVSVHLSFVGGPALIRTTFISL